MRINILRPGLQITQQLRNSYRRDSPSARDARQTRRTFVFDSRRCGDFKNKEQNVNMF